MPIAVQATYTCDHCGEETAVTTSTTTLAPAPIPEGWRQAIVPDPAGAPAVHNYGPNCAPLLAEFLKGPA